MQEKKHRPQGNQDETEKNRRLSPAEERRLLRYKSMAESIIYMDHPTQAGGAALRRRSSV